MVTPLLSVVNAFSYQNKIQRFSIIFLSMLLLTGCLGGFSMGPDTSQLENSLQLALPGHLTLKSFTVDGQDNIGSEAEPIIRTRFSAMVSVKEDTWEQEKVINKVPVIRLVNPKGYEAKLYGLAASKKHMGNWRTEFRFENLRELKRGHTRAALPSIAVDSKDTARMAELKKQEKENSDKLAAEKERERVAALKLKKERAFAAAKDKKKLNDELRALFQKRVSYRGILEDPRGSDEFILSITPKGNAFSGSVEFPSKKERFKLTGEHLTASNQLLITIVEYRHRTRMEKILKLQFDDVRSMLVGNYAFRDGSGSRRATIKLL